MTTPGVPPGRNKPGRLRGEQSVEGLGKPGGANGGCGKPVGEGSSLPRALKGKESSGERPFPSRVIGEENGRSTGLLRKKQVGLLETGTRPAGSVLRGLGGLVAEAARRTDDGRFRHASARPGFGGGKRGVPRSPFRGKRARSCRSSPAGADTPSRASPPRSGMGLRACGVCAGRQRARGYPRRGSAEESLGPVRRILWVRRRRARSSRHRAGRSVRPWTTTGFARSRPSRPQAPP